LENLFRYRKVPFRNFDQEHRAVVQPIRAGQPGPSDTVITAARG